MDQVFVGPETAGVPCAGPLGKQVETFLETLRSSGYAVASIAAKLRALAQLSLWLERRRFGLRDLDEARIRQFLGRRCRQRHVRRDTEATAVQFLHHVRTTGVVPAACVVARHDPAAEVETAYATYLREERGLSSATLANYLPLAHRFLVDRCGSRSSRLKKARAEHVSQFVLRNARTMGPRRAQLLVTALRSFLRFAFLRGETVTDLTPAVPTVAAWRLAGLPKFIPAQDVQRLLRACDRRTSTGRRDHAILLLLARLGLRAGEVVQMRLEDIDWDAGEVIVRGKGGRIDRLPIPSDVGEALAGYLRRDRPPCASRHVFIRVHAPHRGFASSVAVCTIVRRVIVRAGLRTPTKGAHLLRHSLATDLLRRGASLAEIGDLLRHRSPDTTALYAKVDLTSLRQVARPWLGGAA